MTIAELDEVRAGDFRDLIGEAELGSHYERDNQAHRAWVDTTLTRYFARGARFFGGYAQDGSRLGYAVLVIDDMPGFRCKSELISLGVAPVHRRKHIGSALVAHCIDLTRALGLYCCYTSTYAGDTGTVTFYLRNGFVPVATLPDVHGPRDEGQIFLRVIVGPPDWQP